MIMTNDLLGLVVKVGILMATVLAFQGEDKGMKLSGFSLRKINRGLRANGQVKEDCLGAKNLEAFWDLKVAK